MNLNLDLGLTQNNAVVEENTVYDHLVIGGGPAGLNSALYAKRKGLEVAIVAGSIGGQLVNTSMVDNYLGFNEISGEGLVEVYKKHVDSLDIPIAEYEQVAEISKEGSVFHLKTELGKTYKAKTILLATGGKSRKLGVEGEERLAGRGVAYCAICDAPFYKNRDVIIVGGGNSAVEAAIDLAKVATSVTIVHRSQFRADQILVDQLYTNDKITVHLETQIQEIVGDQFVTGVKVLHKETGQVNTISTDGIFIEIGVIPNSQTFKDLVDLNDRGEIVVDSNKKTSVEGIYAAGDVTDGPFNQIIIAASDGAIAALSASEYLNQQVAVNEEEVA
jgi:alkyl hydroperoxide reductase subunit F